MATVKTSLAFLADIPLYDREKPYFIIPAVENSIDPNDPRITNVQLVEHPTDVIDARGKTFRVEDNGFQVIYHKSHCLNITDIRALNDYKAETESFLSSVFPDAEHIYTYDCRVRLVQAFKLVIDSDVF